MTSPAPGGPDLPISARATTALAVAAAVDTVPGVRRSPGNGIEVSTQHAGGKVIGVAVEGGRVRAHLVAETLPLPPLLARVEEAIRSALGPVVDAVDLVVDDLEVAALPRRSPRLAGGTT